MVNRERALRDLLRPIRFDESAPVQTKRSNVVKRHQMVRAAYPFMDDTEQAQAETWFETQSYTGLWE